MEDALEVLYQGNGGIGSFTAIVHCLALGVSFVASMYVWHLIIPGIGKRDRDDPTVVKLRIVSGSDISLSLVQ